MSSISIIHMSAQELFGKVVIKLLYIDSDTYALTCYRYIELNPVRVQGMAKHPSEYPWSNYRHNALGQSDTLELCPIYYTRILVSVIEARRVHKR